MNFPDLNPSCTPRRALPILHHEAWVNYGCAMNARMDTINSSDCVPLNHTFMKQPCKGRTLMKTHDSIRRPQRGGPWARVHSAAGAWGSLRKGPFGSWGVGVPGPGSIRQLGRWGPWTRVLIAFQSVVIARWQLRR